MRRLAAGLLSLSLSACASLPGQMNRELVRTYVLAVEVPVVQSLSPPSGPKVLVSLPEAWPAYGSPRIAYVKRPHEVNYYAYSEWADTPPRMLEPLLIRALESSGQFSGVLSASSSAVANLRLDTEIVSLHHEFYTNPSQGRAVIRAQLIDSATGRVLGTKTFHALTPAATEDPYGGVKAMSQSLRRVLDEIVVFCVGAARDAGALTP